VVGAAARDPQGAALTAAVEPIFRREGDRFVPTGHSRGPWDPGSQLVYQAFDDYFMGRPKIDEITIRIIPDPNTQVASLLSGAIDGTLGITLGQQQVISGWDQGLLGMKVGGRRRLTIPPDLAYGAQGQPPTIPANAPLVFDVDLTKIG